MHLKFPILAAENHQVFHFFFQLSNDFGIDLFDILTRKDFNDVALIGNQWMPAQSLGIHSNLQGRRSDQNRRLGEAQLLLQKAMFSRFATTKAPARATPSIE